MRKILVMMMILALTIAAQAQGEIIDTSKFVVTYDHAVQTKMGHDDREIVDSCCVALMVGTRHTMQMEYYQYVWQCLGDRSVQYEMESNSIHLYPNIYGNYPDGVMTTREFLAPRMYVIEEPMNAQQWTLTDDTLTVMGYACKMATCHYAGRDWTVCYTEDIPSTAGPWKLRGLPGLIVKAEDSEGIHCFELYGTKNEVRGIGTLDHPELQKLSRKKLMEFKKKTLGNPRYAKEPTYYVAEEPDDFGEMRVNGVVYYSANHMLIPQKSHVYQPLELE